MPASVRGGPRKPTRPRAEAPASPKARTAARNAAPPAGKLQAARNGVGVSPGLALTVAGGALVVALVATLATGHRAERLGQAMMRGVDGEFADLGFKLKTVHIEGASPMAKADILNATALYQDQPTLGLDLADLRARVEGVGWVKSAKVVRLLPDTVFISVEERPALAVWQHSGAMRVIDGEGGSSARPTPRASRSCRWWWGRAPTRPPAPSCRPSTPGRACVTVWRRWCASTTAAGTCA
jgi:cell division protein FtsQ